VGVGGGGGGGGWGGGGGGGGAVVKLRDDLNSAAEVYVAHFTCLYHCSIILYLRSFKTTVYLE
jgi:hypothetical protein